MRTHWKKMGRIFCPTGTGCFKSHAMRPIPYALPSGKLRLFFSSRDDDDRMLPTYIDVEAETPERIHSVREEPLIPVGSPGHFDDSGVTMGSLVDLGNTAYIYYTGWKRRRVVSFELSIGIILWDKVRDTFSRLFDGPVLAQDRTHPLLVGGPCVIASSGLYRMWYCSGTEWAFPEGNAEPIYTVCYAESEDGVSWRQKARNIIPYQFSGEVISAPWVVMQGDSYAMWYCRRGSATKEAKNYRIGYAESSDGVHWARMDDLAGISVSDTGWDSEMVCYPAIHSQGDTTFMFYTGNKVGRDGIGYAIATREDDGPTP